MFTGIVSDIGVIRSAEQRGDRRLIIACHYDMGTVALGASIACSGVCLTVVDKGQGADGGWFAVDVSGETMSKTAPDMWNSDRRLNLERALRVGDELGGHIVTGHVDGVGHVVDVGEDGGSRCIGIAVPRPLAPYIAAKGSVTIDGVSLTVNTVCDQDDGTTRFTVNIIPHTWAVTALCDLKMGQAVNIEIDILARYLMRMREATNVQ